MRSKKGIMTVPKTSEKYRDTDTITLIVAMLLSTALTTAALKMLMIDPLAERLEAVQSHVGQDLPIAVLNSLTIRPVDIGSDEETLTKYFKQVREYADYLRGQGKIVIEAESLYRYPENLEIHSEDIQKHFNTGESEQ
jgi:hypothetical protein